MKSMREFYFFLRIVWILSVLAIALLSCSASGQRQAATHLMTSDAKPVFIYDDLDAFASSYREYEAGAELLSAMQKYMANTSPAYSFYAERYGVTAESIAKQVTQHPKYYARLLTLKPQLQQYEEPIARGITKLNTYAPGNMPAPIYYLIGNMTAGGTPTELRPPQHSLPYGVAVAVESVSMAPDADKSEFPGPYGGGYLADIPYVVVHEMMHIYQARLQGIDNYRSIYKPGPNNINLALAVREGCADYVTYLATGKMRTGDRHTYGIAHEVELWSQFQAIQNQPATFDNGWFGKLDPKTPDWPPQIGYWVGMRMCEAYYTSASDPQQAMNDIFAAYSTEHMQKFAAAYSARF